MDFDQVLFLTPSAPKKIKNLAFFSYFISTKLNLFDKREKNFEKSKTD